MKDQNQNTHQPVHNPSSDHIQLPKRDRAKTVWIVVAIIAIAALIGLAAFGYVKVKNLNKQISDQQAQINELNNTKKTLEDAAKSAASGVANAVLENKGTRNIPELGVKYTVSSDNANTTYAFQTVGEESSKAIGLSTTDLMSTNANVIGSTSENKCNAYASPLGRIIMYKPGVILFDKKVEDQVGPNVKKIGNNYFVKQPAQFVCSENPSVFSLIKTLNPKVLDSIFNSLQAQ